VFGDLELCCEKYLLEDLEVSGFLSNFHLELKWDLESFGVRTVRFLS
jgi:hypothetical protein